MTNSTEQSLILFAWGDNHRRQLGIETVAESCVREPTLVNFFNASPELCIDSIACGYAHTIFLTTSGTVYSTAVSIDGAKGKSYSGTKPSIVELLNYHTVVAVAAGRAHSLALTDSGQVFSWGDPKNNVLGRDHQVYDNGLVIDYSNTFPRIVKKLAHELVIQIATFADHCLALTDQGKLFAWGANEYGQCGVGHCDPVTEPTLIESIAGVPIARIACGATHSVMLTKSAGFWSWGDNRSGQLGKPDEQRALFPVNIRAIRQQRAVHVACGEESTFVLTLDGQVFSFGANVYGQTGHGKTTPQQSTPRLIADLMGSTVMQVVAGRHHTHTVKSGCIYAFGVNGDGQCGIGTKSQDQVFQLTQVSVLPAVSTRSKYQSSTVDGTNVIINGASGELFLKEVFAGGNHSFALLTSNQSDAVMDMRRSSSHRRFRPILCVDRHFLNDCLEYGRRDCQVSSMDEHVSSCYGNVEKIYSSLACLNASFLVEENSAHFGCSTSNSGIMELSRVREYSTKLLATRFSGIMRQQLARHILSENGGVLRPNPPDVESLRIMLLLPLILCPSTQVPSVEFIRTYLVPFVRVSVALERTPEKVYKSWLQALGSDFLFYVHLWRNTITRYLEQPDLREAMKSNNMEQSLRIILDELAFLFHISKSLTVRKKVPLQEFYIPLVVERINLPQDYVAWRTTSDNEQQRSSSQQHTNSSNSSNRQLIFCNYPFIFDGAAKVQLLRTDAIIQKQHAAHQGMQFSVMNAIFHGSNVVSTDNQFLNIIVNRRDLVMQSLAQLSQASELDLKKPLRIQFVGEEAEDAGGVRKEYFLLLMREMLDTKYGMFIEYEETRTIWFNDASFEEEDMFFLVGACCGLAIYNDVIIHVNFPLPLYTKLLEPIGGPDEKSGHGKTAFSNLQYLSPTLHRSLTELLDYTGDDFENVFSLNFAISRERWGVTETVELRDGGAREPVTQANKLAYVELYADFVLNKSVAKQYGGFHKGFHKVAGVKMLKLFQPDELMAMVCGSENYDWHEFEKNAQYKGVYDDVAKKGMQHEVVRWFWDVFHNDFGDEQRRKFLLYLTGSDRVPLQGMRQIKICIQPVNAEEHLPVAHTCFNLLDLPLYRSRDQLRRKLMYAIEHAQGFALV